MSDRLISTTVVLVLLVLMAGCTTVPYHTVWQPWRRTLGEVGSGTKTPIRLVIDGDTKPLLGTESLTVVELRKKVESLLKRKGFLIEPGKAELEFRLKYETVRYSSTVMRTTSRSAYSFGSAGGMGVGGGLGIFVAAAVGSATSSTSTEFESQAEYLHTLSLEVFGSDSSSTWKGETMWDSDDADILPTVTYATQLVLAELPVDDSVIPQVQAIKPSHIVSYYTLNADDQWFTCPALPYEIRFDWPVKVWKPSHLESIEHTEALEAYIDLLRTAEYALPFGKRKWNQKDAEVVSERESWWTKRDVDPARPDHWRKVMLGGTYDLMPDQRSINILIRLSGRTDGYVIDRCWIATPDEWAAFQNRLAVWKKVLRDYYDVYEK